MRHFWSLNSETFLEDLDSGTDLKAILQKSLNETIFLYIFILKIRLNGVRASIPVVQIKKFY